MNNSKIIDGTALARKLEEDLKFKIKDLKEKPMVVSILIGDDPASVLYSNIKKNKAKEFGIDFEIERFPKDIEFSLVKSEIEKLNADSKVTGIMIQLPLPQEFLTVHLPGALIDKIDPKKDVDGLTGKGLVLPATVQGVLSILEDEKVSLVGKKIAVVGSEGMIGRPMVEALQGKGANVLKIDKRDPATSLNDIKKADIVISCTGVNGLVKSEVIKEGAVLIDVGLGDFDPRCFEKASSYTPSRGGVGPMTVISLMENTLDLMYN